jgi:glyoxylase-like metal-dependent hydrolase (beta-lactamase superfamily II)
LAAVLIDLQHLGRSRVIASYLLAGDEPALVDCGPTTCLGVLEDGLAGEGLAVEDLRHLVLTHIHLDHAGAAGALVRRNPKLQVHVSEIGAPHLVDPSRLEASARRLYADDFDRLWGELVPVPKENVQVVGGDVPGLEAWPTPGHASHHVSYLSEDGTCYSGDVTGVVIAPSTLIAPVCPPPEVDLEAWERTIDELERRGPERLALIHFGVFEDVERHLEELRRRLRDWAERVRAGATEEQFAAEAAADLADDRAAYEQAMPFWQSYAGLRRYWEKRAA